MEYCLRSRTCLARDKDASVSRPVARLAEAASSRFPNSVACTTATNAAPRRTSRTRSCASTEL